MTAPDTNPAPTGRGSSASDKLELPRVHAYRSLREIAPLAAHLDELNMASRRPSPFGTFAYMETFLAHDEFAVPEQETRFLVAFDGDTPVGYLPLRKLTERLFGIPFKSIRFLIGHDNDRPRAVARPEDEGRCCEAFYRYLFEVETDWSAINLQEQDAESKLWSPPAVPALRRCYVRHFPTNPNATLFLPHKSLGEYLHTFSKSHRRHLEQAVRKLSGAGELEVITTSDPSSINAVFDLYLDIDRRSWKAKVDGHIGRHPKRLAFFRRLLDRDQPMRMLVQVLLLDGLPVAGMVSGHFDNRLYAFEEAFDEAYRDLSPGNAMMLLLVREAIDKGYQSINLLGNYAYYKALWHATITDTAGVQIFRLGSLVHLKAVAGDIKRKLLPPVTQRDVGFNLDRRDADEPGGNKGQAARPERRDERERAAVVLRALETADAKVDRLAGDALDRALPFALRHAKGGSHVESAEGKS